MNKYESVERKIIELSIKAPFQHRKDFVYDDSFRYIGYICQVCGLIIDMPTNINKIASYDKHGNNWALVNAVSQMATHMVEKDHNDAKLRINKT